MTAHHNAGSALARAGATALTLAALAAAGPAAAQPASGATLEKAGWNYSLGAIALYAPSYEGSDEYKVGAAPVVEITYGNRFFFNREGLGVNLLTGPDLTAGIAIGSDFGRDQDADDDLHGLGDIDETAELRAFADYSVGPVTLSAGVRFDVLGEGHEGVVASLGATYRMMPTDRLMLIAGPSVTWASDNYMQAYFGISPTQAVASGYQTYEAEGGFKDVSFGITAIYALSDRWQVLGLANYSRLLEDAADSPLVAVSGSEDQFFAGLGLTYSF